MPHNNPKGKPQQGPDPAVMQAVQRLVQTELSPLEEVIFKSWMEANQLEESPDMPFDYRGLYQQTGGKVHAPGELGTQIARQHSIKTLMDAQQHHDSMSPIKHLMDAGGDPSILQGGVPDVSPTTPGTDLPADSGVGGMMGNMNGSEESSY